MEEEKEEKEEKEEEEEEEMPAWQEQEVTKATLTNWIDSCTKKSAPPIFRLRLPETHKLEVGTERRRRVVSGILELRLRKSTLDDASSLHERLRQIAADEDKRGFRQVEETGSQVIVAEFESWLPSIAVPVIGPGGRIIVAAQAEAATADVVVRRREDALTSQWRPREELVESLRRRIAEREAGNVIATCWGTFGYFELSKYERQEVLRPAFLLSLLIVFADDSRVEWSDSIVEPATTAEEIGPMDGLGSWAE